VVPEVERRDTPGGPRVVFVHHVPPPFMRLRAAVEAYASGVLATMSALSGRPLRASWVTFPLPTPADSRRYERFFACPVAWAGPAVEVAFDAAVLEYRLPRADTRLFGYLSKRAAELLAAIPDDADVVNRTRREIAACLAQGEPRLGTVARRLGLSERTLHRRLTQSGSGFAALVEQARRDRAQMLLRDPALSCSEVAALLGYSDPAVFFRAFKRWTGATPQAWRRQPSTGITILPVPAASLRTDEDFWRLYHASFVSAEREPADVIIRSIERGPGFALAAQADGKTVGLATGQVLVGPAATFLVYLAVDPAWRSQRLGRALFDEADRLGSARLRDQGRRAIGTVWEIDDPDADVDAGELDIRRKRQRFFENLGGRALPVSYLQPPVDGTTEVPMRLMFRPAAGMEAPQGDAIADLIHAIYFEKYRAINEIPSSTIERLAARVTRREIR
jgi:AraC-like DNA-binding protein